MSFMRQAGHCSARLCGLLEQEDIWVNSQIHKEGRGMWHVRFIDLNKIYVNDS